MGRRKKLSDGESPSVIDKMYFTQGTEEAIVRYNLCDSSQEREDIYRGQIAKPFDKLAENVINRFKFPYINMTFDALKRDVVAYLIMNLAKYKQANGKAFSYFSVCAKNYLILQNSNAYKEQKRDESIFDSEEYLTIDVVAGLEAPNDRDHDDTHEFVTLMITYWEQNINRHFKKRRDIEIATAVMELFRRADGIENFNKKALYLMIREMTDCKTSYITKVVNKMREITAEHLQEYYSQGTLDGGYLDD
jgi:hypothetical protein